MNNTSESIPSKNTDSFVNRHIGPNRSDLNQMLEQIGVASLDDLINETVPAGIRLSRELKVEGEGDEFRFLKSLKSIAAKNKVFRSYIGLGYHNNILPGVIARNVLENPGWYTQYTPYQAEISQGRLEALLNFQTMVIDLTGLEIANASLLDEGTAAAEAMTLLHRTRPGKKSKAHKFFVADSCLPQTIDILKTRAEPLGIELEIGDFKSANLGEDIYGALLQYPAENGEIHDYRNFIETAQTTGIRTAMACDLLSLTILTPPGELGADIALGNSQRLGVPMGYGGPHAAFFATRDELKRQVPGRLIGISLDVQGNQAYRMALQTREQHIRREKATSNICTAQALLAIMASMYAVYHGPVGLKKIALRIHGLAARLESALQSLGFEQLNSAYFDTLRIKVGADLETIRAAALAKEINFRYINPGSPEGEIAISLDEPVSPEDLRDIIEVFASAKGKTDAVLSDAELFQDFPGQATRLPAELIRTSEYLTHPVFNTYHSETAMLRYINSLAVKDLALNTAMIPLGSCTMKLNATTQMVPVTWPEFGQIHPFVPGDQVEGYLALIKELEADLCRITGFHACSLQPNSGAQGEFSGLMSIRAYHLSRGNANRKVVLIPTSAHGTNPASAVMAGMKVVLVECDASGNIDLEDLQNKASKHEADLGALMITYPSTHGVFEEEIRQIIETVHKYGGQVYMDGANMNAQVGLTSPAEIGADVCHLNLHKTFAIPHGGGGPGMGPICVAEHLAPFLPGHPLVDQVGGAQATTAVSAAPFGSASILPISYAYIKLLGTKGLLDATRYAILNANYLKSRLEQDYKILFTGKNGRVAHEMIIDVRGFKKEAGIEVEDIAKRLMDFGFHAPTMSWPIPGTLMVEPTESEPKEELDRFCEAMLTIRAEIQDVVDGKIDGVNNPLKNAPHTAAVVTADTWDKPYTRTVAAYPLPGMQFAKFWPAVGRIDGVYGDRNLICACPPVEAFREVEEEAPAGAK